MRYERWPQQGLDVGGSQGLPFPKRYRVTWVGSWSGRLAACNDIQYFIPVLGQVYPYAPNQHLCVWMAGANYPGGPFPNTVNLAWYKFYHTSERLWAWAARIWDNGFELHEARGEALTGYVDNGDEAMGWGCPIKVGFDPAWFPLFGLLEPALWTEFPPDET